ncbi:MAG: CubicO group peptidase (beta-lactamase class C family) [Parvicellaceae bacterium]|jgi:CubicO group peptidase (beta-lactamase class C family)
MILFRFSSIALTILFSTCLVNGNVQAQSALDIAITDEMNTENLPSVSAVIVKDGEVVWMKSYGFSNVATSELATPQTPYMLASVSKTFTATAVMQCVEDGLIDLDADIDIYLPFSTRNPAHLSTPITTRMLLTHTSSVQDASVVDNYYAYGTDPIISLANVSQQYFAAAGSDFSAANFLAGQPGTVYEYSNMGNALAAYVVEAVTATLFYEYCDANIFDRLCMPNTSWRLSDYDTNDLAKPYKYAASVFTPYQHYTFADYPNGGLRTSVEDLANYLIMYQQNGIFNGDTLLQPSTVSTMLSFQVPAIEATQGISWYQDVFYPDGVTAADFWTHNGGESGVSSDVVLYPAFNAAVAVITNGEGDAAYIADALLGEAETLLSTGVGNPSCATALSTYTNKVISIFPNPAETEFHITETLHNVQVVDMMGKIVYKSTSVDLVNTVSWANGIYLLLGESQLGEHVQIKLIKH